LAPAKNGLKPGQPFAVLGFGDRQFARFCQFAHQVEAAMLQAGGTPLLALETINRQSSQEFSRWGQKLGAAMGQELSLNHIPDRPRTHQLQLVERIAYGQQVNAPTHVLRFKAVGDLPCFEAGDGHHRAGQCRATVLFLASNSDDGTLEICVRKHEGGVCSGFLHELPAAHRSSLHPAQSAFPASLGQTTGDPDRCRHRYRAIGRFYPQQQGPPSDASVLGWTPPGLGLSLRAGAQPLPGGPTSDPVAGSVLPVQDRSYVQDRLISDALALRRLIEKGAQVLVCGSREMAKGVMHALDEVLAPST
jgi:sulfite reductase (NADPH) flavoprotein alpha-component